MKYYGKIQDPKDFTTKEYVDARSGVTSVNNKTGDVSLNAGDVGADASGTAQGLINALDFSNPAAEGTAIAFIDAVSQTNGKISATKKTVRSATTSQTGVVQLNSATNSTSTTQAATPSAVKDAYDHGGVQSVNGSTGAVSVYAAQFIDWEASN